MSYHKLLQDQLAKFFPDGKGIPENCRELLDSVSESYTKFESPTKCAGLEIANGDAGELQSLQQSTLKLKGAIALLEPQYLNSLNTNYNELTKVLDRLDSYASNSAELKAELLRLKEEADKASRSKIDFLAVMNHEIRTSLNAISGIAHLMMNDGLPVSQLENMRTLNISAENLLDLVNDILDFNNIEEGKIRLSERNIDLRQLLANIKSKNRLRAEQAGNILKCTPDSNLPRFIVADDIRLSQVLNNLVSNAIKFTRNGSISIEVTVVNEAETELELRFAVSDTGIGIAKDKQQLIFEIFSEENALINREYGGAGLGLAITQRLLKLMNSDVSLQSEIGLGSTFAFNITLKKGKEIQSEEKQENGIRKNDLAGMKILLVDDVEFNIMVAEKMLLNWNAKVEVAENGLHAIKKARDGNFDLILMDLQMPVLDGYSATKHIREFNKDVPIIALTASASSDTHEKTIEVGMNGYVSKPFMPDDLYDTIYRFIIRRKAS